MSGGENSFCFPFINFPDFDLSGNLKLFTLGWKLQYKEMVGPFPTLLRSQGRETHFIGVILSCIFNTSRHCHHPFPCYPQPNHRNKKKKTTSNPKLK